MGEILIDSINESGYANSAGMAGDTGLIIRYVISFTVGAYDLAATRVKLYLKKSGTPAASMYGILYSDDSGPDSLVVKSHSVNSSTLTTSNALIEFNFGGKTTLTAGATYYVGLEFEGGDSSNYVLIGRAAGSGQAYHVIYGSANWVANSNEIIFYIYGEEDEALLFGANF